MIDFFTPRNTTTLDKQLLVEKPVKTRVNNYVILSLSNIFCTVLIYFVLNALGDVNQLHLNLWAGSQLGSNGIWFLLYLNRAKNNTPAFKYWTNWIKLLATIWSGANWGLVWVLFIDPNNLQTAFVLNTLICGVVLGMVVSSPLSKRLALASLLPCLVPIIIKSLLIGGTLFNWIAAITFVFLIACYSFFKRLQGLYYGVMKEREKSEQLAIDLAYEKQQIEIISQGKTQFLASASHDLRQPIQAMYFFQSALAALITEPEQKKLLAKIGEANTALSKMLEPLLDISKLDSGIMELQLEVIWVDDLFYRAEQNYKDRATSEGIELRVMSAGVHKLYVDSHHLERILNNLIENAIKHMGRPGKILVGVRPSGKHLSIEVHDNGKGIPDTEKDKIFDEFYQIDNSERNSAKGLGLGLPIIQRLAKLNGGLISLSSIKGKGSCFRVKMTSYQPDDPQDSMRLESGVIEPEQEPEWELGPAKTLFIIEDDPKVATAQAAMLESWGFTVRVANDIDSALHHLNTDTPNMIISDYQLSDNQTGLEVIKLIREKLSCCVPAIILTGNTRPDIVRILSEQSIPILYKPVQPITLKALISDVLKA